MFNATALKATVDVAGALSSTSSYSKSPIPPWGSQGLSSFPRMSCPTREMLTETCNSKEKFNQTCDRRTRQCPMVEASLEYMVMTQHLWGLINAEAGSNYLVLVTASMYQSYPSRIRSMWVTGTMAYLGNTESQEICDQHRCSLSTFFLAYPVSREVTQEW